MPHELRVLSAHRTPDAMAAYAREAVARGLKVLIAGAGGAAHLPGHAGRQHAAAGDRRAGADHDLNGLDALLSIVQMPRGVPVATVAIGGGANAGLLAVQILATSDPALLERCSTTKPSSPRRPASRTPTSQARPLPVAVVIRPHRQSRP